MNIDLHIEELTLLGFAPGDRQRVARAVQDELVRLLAGNNLPGVFEREGELQHLNGGSFAVRPGERPESIGVRIGRKVFEGMAGTRPGEGEQQKI